VPEKVPLATLVSWAWIAQTIEIDNAFEALARERVGRHFRISLPMWTNGLRFITEDGITIADLCLRARARCNVPGLERWGWISIEDGRRTKAEGYGTSRNLHDETVLTPTRAGSYARKLWPRVISGVEERWSERFGADVIGELRDTVVEATHSMPWSPPEVHPADGFFTHVVEGERGTDGESPLIALLGQRLTNLTLEHERRSKLSLPLGAGVVRAIGDEGARIRDLPALTGLSKEAVAMATGYLERHGLAASEPDSRLRLTQLGLDGLAEYRETARASTSDRLRLALAAVVDQRDALAAGLVPPPGCWRGENPYLAQTKRLLADPTGSLPWHPMVLHRGAWPDGS
jgi:hypothetical protein